MAAVGESLFLMVSERLQIGREPTHYAALAVLLQCTEEKLSLFSRPRSFIVRLGGIVNWFTQSAHNTEKGTIAKSSGTTAALWLLVQAPAEGTNARYQEFLELRLAEKSLTLG